MANWLGELDDFRRTRSYDRQPPGALGRNVVDVGNDGCRQEGTRCALRRDAAVLHQHDFVAEVLGQAKIVENAALSRCRAETPGATD